MKTGQILSEYILAMVLVAIASVSSFIIFHNGILGDFSNEELVKEVSFFTGIR